MVYWLIALVFLPSSDRSSSRHRATGCGEQRPPHRRQDRTAPSLDEERQIAALLVLFVLLVILPALAALLYLIFNPTWLGEPAAG